MQDARKLRLIPKRNIWNGSRRRNFAGLLESKGTFLQGGSSTHGKVRHLVWSHFALGLTSSKGYCSNPALHSWQQANDRTVPTFWYDLVKDPTFAIHSISSLNPMHAGKYNVPFTSIPASHASPRFDNTVSIKPLSRFGKSLLYFFEG